ncbi:MAG: hypothetical protein EPN25_10760 [Nitrospirae bacterium]|nr:MAG: hypothetical protein EPN25_10760 [Nitrospirota bacterium]
MTYESRISTLILRMIPVCILLVLISCSSMGAGRNSATGAEARYALLEQTWGVRPLYVRLTAEGLMLDFRYHVVDAEKAAPLFERKNKAYVLDQATGAKFLVPESPKVGALRTTRPPLPGKSYFIIFANPGRYVKKGSIVTVVIGDFRAENLVVE